MGWGLKEEWDSEGEDVEQDENDKMILDSTIDDEGVGGGGDLG